MTVENFEQSTKVMFVYDPNNRALISRGLICSCPSFDSIINNPQEGGRKSDRVNQKRLTQRVVYVYDNSGTSVE